MYNKLGLNTLQTSEDRMINDMAEMKSDRAVLCLKNSEGLGHAVPVVLLGN
jgi:hypothetical protein